MSKHNLFWPSNEQIRSDSLRVISSQGKQVGVLSKAEALEMAKKENLDLVLITNKTNPPIAKIINYGKFRYQEEKKLKEVQKKSKPGDLKEIRFSPFIGDNDYQVRLKRIKEFLTEKNKVRLVVIFRVKQLGSKQFGYNIFKKILSELEDSVNVDMEPKFLGKRLMMVISPTSKIIIKKKEKIIENEKNESKK